MAGNDDNNNGNDDDNDRILPPCSNVVAGTACDNSEEEDSTLGSDEGDKDREELELDEGENPDWAAGPHCSEVESGEPCWELDD